MMGGWVGGVREPALYLVCNAMECIRVNSFVSYPHPIDDKAQCKKKYKNTNIVLLLLIYTRRRGTELLATNNNANTNTNRYGLLLGGGWQFFGVQVLAGVVQAVFSFLISVVYCWCVARLPRRCCHVSVVLHDGRILKEDDIFSQMHPEVYANARTLMQERMQKQKQQSQRGL